MASVGGYPTGRVDCRWFRCCLGYICGGKLEKRAKLSNIYGPGGSKISKLKFVSRMFLLKR